MEIKSIYLENYIDNTSRISELANIGKNNKIWMNVQIREFAKIGDGCTIGKDVYIDKNVIIGDNCKIENGVQIFDGVTIGDNVFIAPGVVFTNDLYPKAVGNWNIVSTKVKNNVSIGANSTIICGIILEEYTLIGAGSVITKNTKKNGLYYGNPAKFIKIWR